MSDGRLPLDGLDGRLDRIHAASTPPGRGARCGRPRAGCRNRGPRARWWWTPRPRPGGRRACSAGSGGTADGWCRPGSPPGRCGAAAGSIRPRPASPPGRR
ncbi:hypothetical protein ABZ760_24265 [Streptomyces sp. NPDC006658]|uniref:hypothetical protein n=1 Tax=Streptomyces sp. NPDC006658 TaxID=3156900 RepID=UPI0033CC9D13